MESPRGRLFVQDMIRYSQDVLAFTAGVDEVQFLGNLEKQYAVTRALEVIGEAAKAVPENVRILAPKIQWRQISGMRDKLIHHYFGVKLETVWAVVTQDIPQLIPLLERLL